MKPNPGFSISGKETSYPRKTRRDDIRWSPVSIYRPNGEVDVELMTIRNDESEIRRVLVAEAEKAGTSLEDLTRCLRRGRPSEEDERRRLVLAGIVHDLRERQARLEAIAHVLGCSKSTALQLARLPTLV